jgi:hypothetical protein
MTVSELVYFGFILLLVDLFKNSYLISTLNQGIILYFRDTITKLILVIKDSQSHGGVRQEIVSTNCDKGFGGGWHRSQDSKIQSACDPVLGVRAEDEAIKV